MNFKNVIYIDKLKKAGLEVTKHSKNKYSAQDKTIPRREEYVEGGSPALDTLSWLIPKSSFYLAYYLRHLYALKKVTNSDSVVLDIGCGSALLRDLIHKGSYVGRTFYIGIDGDISNIRKATTSPSGNYFFIQQHLNGELPYIKDESCDVVIAMEIIEHMKHGQGKKFLQEINRVAKPGARIILSTPNNSTVKEGEKLHWKYHLYEYTVEEIEKLLKKNGFKLEQTFGWTIERSKYNRIENSLSKPELEVFNSMGGYINKALLRQIFATAHPELASAVVYSSIKEEQ